MKKFPFYLMIFSFIVAAIIVSCEEEKEDETTPATAKFAVLSDIHYFDASLFDNTLNMSFEYYLAADRKLIKESGAILDAALAEIEAEKPDFLMISGDLTKDGEKVPRTSCG